MRVNVPNAFLAWCCFVAKVPLQLAFLAASRKWFPLLLQLLWSWDRPEILGALLLVPHSCQVLLLPASQLTKIAVVLCATTTDTLASTEGKRKKNSTPTPKTQEQTSHGSSLTNQQPQTHNTDRSHTGDRTNHHERKKLKDDRPASSTRKREKAEVQHSHRPHTEVFVHHRRLSSSLRKNFALPRRVVSLSRTNLSPLL